MSTDSTMPGIPLSEIISGLFKIFWIAQRVAFIRLITVVNNSYTGHQFESGLFEGEGQYISEVFFSTG
jgi:hypothetical protein